MVAMSSLVAAVDRGGRGVLWGGVGAVARVGRVAGAVLPHLTVQRFPATAGLTEAEPVSFVEAEAAGLVPIRVAYERQGAGEPVVLLHGLGLNRRTWDAVVPLLTSEREVIAIDLPGFGQSPDWPTRLPRDLPTTATALDAVFTALNVRSPHVVGHSLGGLIALQLGQAGLARSVTALAPAGFWNEAERRYAFAVLGAARRIARTVPATAAERLSETAVGRAVLAGMLYGDPAQCPPGAVTACLQALRDAAGFEATLRAGRTPGLFTGQIPSVPVTIAWGTGDRILPQHQARRAQAMLPQARLIALPGCGHVPMNDAPERIARIILQATSPTAATLHPTRQAPPISGAHTA